MKPNGKVDGLEFQEIKMVGFIFTIAPTEFANWLDVCFERNIGVKEGSKCFGLSSFYKPVTT